MAETSYSRTLSRRELRDRRFARKEAREARLRVMSALDAVVKGGAVYEEPDGSFITSIPAEFLPPEEPKRKSAASAAESIVKRESTNPAYEAELKAKRNSELRESHRPIVAADRPLPLSWEVASHGKNDTTQVQSKLSYINGKGDVPEVYSPGETNPRKEVEAKLHERVAKKIPPPEKKAKPFEYQPGVTKLAPGQQPRIVETVPTTADPEAHERRQRTAAALQTKPFRT